MTKWKQENSVIEIIEELFHKIRNKLNNELEFFSEDGIDTQFQMENQASEPDEYITPDLSAYPPDFEHHSNFLNNEEPDDVFLSDDHLSENNADSPPEFFQDHSDGYKAPNQDLKYSGLDTISPKLNTELSLIQQYYAFDQKGTNPTEIELYLTISVSNTFIINLDFSSYPKKPMISIPKKLKTILGDPYTSLDKLKNWNPKKPPHVVDLLHEMENKLDILRNIDSEIRKILSEYKGELIENSLTKINLQILTYGFKEYLLSLDLKSFPNPPIIDMTPEMQELIRIEVKNLNSYKNWTLNESEPVEIIRELSWLVDKNSRINFEIDLLKEQYKELTYDSMTNTLNLKMKGKMKTQDIVFDFKINLPQEYPIKMPDVNVVNEFEIESQEKIKNDLQSSFNDFFNQWTPYSYLIDLFNLISKKIFEISIVACVICHKIECPFCSLKIAGPEETCHVDCPNCERSYHAHCWEQTIKSFGKCGFCLKPPPPHMLP
ncbi:MAG: hypothetical protein EU544_06195 [Promethearchaeota archaeon]|nr:MAG: hypothetical protein EU544_06195 [Candidatus Lokiarchaeota archaeon]